MNVIRRFVTFVVRHRVAVTVVTAGISAIALSQLRFVHLEIRREASFPQDHPYVRVHNEISEVFGAESGVVIGVVSRNGDALDTEILKKVYRITERLERTPGIVESSLVSVASPYVKAIEATPGGEIDIRPLLPRPPWTPDDLRRLRREVQGEKLFRGTLVSEDGSATAILAEFQRQMPDAEVADAVETAVAPERGDDVRIALAGGPILGRALKRYTKRIVVLFPLALLAIGLIHYEAFRTLQAMFLPLVTALLSVLWTLGVMGALRTPMDSWGAVTPVIILVIAAGHAVQILKRYYEEYSRWQDTRRAVIESTTAVGPAMITAGLAAAIGFGSLTMFGITSVRIFGLLMTCGILSALTIEMTFVPACRSLLPPPRVREVEREAAPTMLDNALQGLAKVVLAHPRRILWVGGVLTGVTLALASRLTVDNSLRSWFVPGSEIRRDDKLLRSKFGGTVPVRILIEGDRDGALIEPAVMRAIDDLEQAMLKDPGVGNAVSIVDHVKRLNQAFEYGAQSAYVIPNDRNRIAQYLLLYGMSEGGDGMSSLIDPTYRLALVRGICKSDSASFAQTFIARLRAFADRRFEGLPARAKFVGGTLGVLTALNETIVREKVINMLQVSLTIFALACVVFRSVVGGLFVTVPLAVSVIANLGAMALSRTPLDMGSATITAMGVSIGADFAFYLLFRVREELHAGGPIEEAVGRSLYTSGKAIFFVSSAVMLGYLVLVLAGFRLWTRLGIFTGFIVGMSALSTLTLLPALTLAVRPRFLSRPQCRASVVHSRGEGTSAVCSVGSH